MTGWIALALIVAMVVATAAIFAGGRKAGVATEAVKAPPLMLRTDCEADPFGQFVVCPSVVVHGHNFQTAAISGGTARMLEEWQRNIQL